MKKKDKISNNKKTTPSSNSGKSGWGLKLRNILLWMFLGAYLVAILGFVEENRSKVVCSGLEVSIKNGETNKFLRKTDVTRVLDRYKLKMKGAPINEINTFAAEELINKNPAVCKTSAFTTIDGKFCVQVEQRRPILRVINKHLQQYYVDENAQIIPLQNQYSAFTLVANGNIEEPFQVSLSRNIFPTKKDTILMPNIIYDLYYLSKYIDNDDFWRSQIEQVYVNSHHEMELIPRVGSHIILFGRASDIDEKFKKLKSIYRTFNQIGWNQYRIINLKYKNQIVCTKR
jgi:cell division protein FtsQ